MRVCTEPPGCRYQYGIAVLLAVYFSRYRTAMRVRKRRDSERMATAARVGADQPIAYELNRTVTGSRGSQEMNDTSRRVVRLASSAIFAVTVTAAGLTALVAPAAAADGVPATPIPAGTAAPTPTPTIQPGTPWG
ncbi:hypothetical protein Mth01_00830 [Sphaerimonospora thailandensis]|uniref:Uncharacterized protein n=2 Tax=Sphaerimonospora thailandensis TaxID=795644 RepID=A0A8J3R4Z6_9ACTN|nr:hypothetical protein Mth01_00830 [Sphaerimonospora thailandensis]